MDKPNPIAALQRQRELIVLEMETERREFQRQRELAGVDRNVARGDCWWPVGVGRNYYNSLNQQVVELTRAATDDENEAEHNFESGKQVTFFAVSATGDVRYFPVKGTVNRVQDNVMVVAVGSPQEADMLRHEDRVGVQVALDETTYRLMLDALDRVIKARDNRLAELREVCYGRRRSEWFTFAPLSFPWLNRTQEQAVNQVLRAKDVAVVHGPPGTGKTTTLVEAIVETLRRESQVLVCAQSNMAVDWISERLSERGVEVLRVGNPTRVTDNMLALTYERRFESHPDYAQLWAMRKALRQVQGRRRGESRHQQVDRLRNRVTELELRIHQDLMDGARVIACTLAGSAQRVLEGTTFGTLFIDEAAQALEAACWIAIKKARRVVLAGDHCQLPPTVKCLDALKGGLGVTLMERVVAQVPQAVSLLRVQYRMNESIMRFSSDWFYGGLVEAAPTVKYRGILDYDTPIEWIETSDDATEETTGDGTGRINRTEAALTIATLERFVDRVGLQHVLDERLDVGIISPYRAQVHYLRHLLKHNDHLRPLRKVVSVNTVDGFQGQERDIIVISLVRNNEQGNIGFLRDLRRMNVAITRARMKLIILGDSATLSRHPFYRQLHAYVEEL